MRVLLIILILMLLPAANLRAQSGASAAFTSDDPLLREIRDTITSGGFPSKEQFAQLQKSNSAAGLEMLEILHRLRYEYDLGAEQLLGKLRSRIPDVTLADLDRWRSAGDLQFRSIDGQARYFRREPSNLLRFCDEAKQRCFNEFAAGSEKFLLTDHLAKIIDDAGRTGTSQVTPIRHRIHYLLTVPPNPAAKVDSILRVWLPYPQQYRQQSDVKLISSFPADPQISPVGIKDSKILPHAQRTAYYERKITDPAKAHNFEITLEYTSHAYYPNISDSAARPLPADFDKTFLEERPPHILFTPGLKKTVAQIVGDEKNPLINARKIFQYVDANMRYCAEEEYCLIPCFSEKALTSKKGDCGIQGILFITMCRAAGIPARWQSGWETKPVGWNMHDWAEFYVEPWGWLPADPSYGLQKSDRPEIREFYFGHQDSYRLIVNLDYGCELIPAKTSLRSEPADFQRGEVELDGRNLYYDQWDYDIQFERHPQ